MPNGLLALQMKGRELSNSRPYCTPIAERARLVVTDALGHLFQGLACIDYSARHLIIRDIAVGIVVEGIGAFD
jgi:hypothetical protein